MLRSFPVSLESNLGFGGQVGTGVSAGRVILCQMHPKCPGKDLGWSRLVNVLPDRARSNP